MIIVVDTNIVFSAILNTQSKIGQLIINGEKYFEFYTIGLLKNELLRHKQKMISIAKFSDKQFNATYHTITSRIKFVDEIILSDNTIEDAVKLVAETDINDALFIALANHLNSKLWTGDKKLIEGLKRKNYSKVLNTNDLYKIFIERQLKDILKKKQ